MSQDKSAEEKNTKVLNKQVDNIILSCKAQIIYDPSDPQLWSTGCTGTGFIRGVVISPKKGCAD